MNLEYYPYFASNDFKDYEFYSEGPKGKIRKAIRFTKINYSEPVFYNLGFGDVSEETDTIDDSTISNNNDRDVVLATVARTVRDFLNMHGNHYVFATGSNAVRTRLYQMSISRLWDEIELDFDVFGFNEGKWTPFKRNVHYDAFLIRRK